MSEWMVIPNTMLAHALQVMNPYPAPEGSDSDVPRSLLEAIVEYLSEDLGCDHSVGICACGVISVVEDLKLALDGLATCPRCGGDGDEADLIERVGDYAWAQECSIKAAQEALGIVKDDLRCMVCDGAGNVPLGDLGDKVKLQKTLVRSEE
jgi:hypothetical protein